MKENTRCGAKGVNGIIPKRSEALDIERRLHAMFAAKSYSPKLRLLSGGNTECFVDDDEIIKTVATLFELVRAGLAQR